MSGAAPPRLEGGANPRHGFGQAEVVDRDLSQLAFWIDECGTNGCRYIDGAFPALVRLFGRGPATDVNDFWPGPLVLCLRRHQLPRRDRLRWSRIANGYVVAGAGSAAARSGIFVPWASTTPIPACAPS